VVLSRLDDRLAEVVRQSVDLFDNGSEESDAVVADLRRSQREWLTVRDACETADCITNAYRVRVDILSARGRSGLTGWADFLAGEYRHEDFMTLTIQVRNDETVRIAISGADPRSARWVCNFTGYGTRTEDGGITVTSADGKKRPLLTMRRVKARITVPDDDLNQATSANDCGMNGTLIWDYLRK
jgi:hypothetical protein